MATDFTGSKINTTAERLAEFAGIERDAFDDYAEAYAELSDLAGSLRTAMLYAEREAKLGSERMLNLKRRMEHDPLKRREPTAAEVLHEALAVQDMQVYAFQLARERAEAVYTYVSEGSDLTAETSRLLGGSAD
jgi:hypothetical protein